ncbi:MAG: dihydrofolate reductase family protein [Chryseolinea sp.]
MRSLILRMQVTLDGFIEGPAADMSWLQTNDPEQWDELFAMLEHTDLFLLGSGMFKDYRDYWKMSLTNPKATENEKRYAEFAEKAQHIVFSKTMKDTGWSNTVVFDGDVIAEVARLKKLPGKDIQIVGGAKLAATLIESGLVDEYILELNPVVVAGGKSFFNVLTQKKNLELKRCERLKSNVVMLHYVDNKS